MTQASLKLLQTEVNVVLLKSRIALNKILVLCLYNVVGEAEIMLYCKSVY